MNILILGPQGSGKGTQARLLSEKFGFFYFEAGEFSRELTRKNPTIKKIVNRGELIPQGIMTNYVSEYLEEKVPERDNILFDGFPRFVSQYEFLGNWLSEKNKKIDLAILLEISHDETIKRLSARRICEKCGALYNLITNPPKSKNCDVCGGKLVQREDDYPEAIQERLNEYHKNIDPMVDLIEKEGILERINGELPIDLIFTEISKVVKKSHG